MRNWLPVLLVVGAGILAGAVSGASVDAKICAGCHPGIAQTYARTGMARSFYQPDAAHEVEDFARGNPFYQRPSGTWYAMLRRDGKYFQRRWKIGYNGAETDVEELQIDYVMGSGNHVRTYLHKTARGTLIELPLAWYAEEGGHWGMNPGHDRDFELPSRTVAYECFGCHNSYPKIPAGHSEPGSEYVYSFPLPEGIDCQRCHGPGGEHVRLAGQRGSAREAIRRAIVNPARLSPERKLEVCMQCHLETTSEPLPHAIAKYDRGPFSYQPGERLGDSVLFFDRALSAKAAGGDDFEIAHSAYRLRQSRCFLATQNKPGKAAMSCTTCHDPHDIPRGAAAATHYNGVCGQCHPAYASGLASQKHPRGTDCVGCHMPKRRTADVVNAVMTDHLIQRRPQATDPLGRIGSKPPGEYRGEVVRYYPRISPDLTENALYNAVAQVTQGANLKNGLPRLVAEITKQKPAQAGFYLELGQALVSAGDAAGAARVFQEAVRREPASPVALLDLGDALTEAGQPQRAVEVLRGGLAREPNRDDPLLWYQLGLALAAAGNSSEAITAFQSATGNDARFADAFEELGSLYAMAGKWAEAESALRSSLRLQPDLAQAAALLGQTLVQRGDLAQSLYYFERALRREPRDTEIRLHYAVALARFNRFDDAETQVTLALRADAASAEAHNLLGTLLVRTGRNEEARHEFGEALRLQPNFDAARRALEKLQ